MNALLIRLVASAAMAAGIAAGGFWAGLRWSKGDLEEAISARATDRAAALQVASEAEAHARATEQQRIHDAEVSREQSQVEIAKAQTAADGARSELDRLRHTAATAASGRAVPSDPKACARADAIAAGTRELFLACAAAYQGVETEAGGLAGKLRALQGAVKAMGTN